MANYQLGPVIGQLGGGEVEVIAEQVAIENDSRTWTLPDGWEAGYIGAIGVGNNQIWNTKYVQLLGIRHELPLGGSADINGFSPLVGEVVISADREASWSGEVTLIRTA